MCAICRICSVLTFFEHEGHVAFGVHAGQLNGVVQDLPFGRFRDARPGGFVDDVEDAQVDASGEAAVELEFAMAEVSSIFERGVVEEGKADILFDLESEMGAEDDPVGVGFHDFRGPAVVGVGASLRDGMNLRCGHGEGLSR
jgi:hypothetical protein